jgi:hypothetical protein
MVKVVGSAHGGSLPPLSVVKTQICRLGLEKADGVGLKSTFRFNRCPAAHPLPGQADGASRVNPPMAGALLTVETEVTRIMARINQGTCFSNNVFITLENLTFVCPKGPTESNYKKTDQNDYITHTKAVVYACNGVFVNCRGESPQSTGNFKLNFKTSKMNCVRINKIGKAG